MSSRAGRPIAAPSPRPKGLTLTSIGTVTRAVDHPHGPTEPDARLDPGVGGLSRSGSRQPGRIPGSLEADDPAACTHGVTVMSVGNGIAVQARALPLPPA
jgi:hypothetical protein